MKFAKRNLFDWATLFYTLIIDESPIDSRIRDVDVEEMISSTDSLLRLEEEKLGHSIKRCWQGEYESAVEVMMDLQIFLKERGFDVEMDEISGYDFRR